MSRRPHYRQRTSSMLMKIAGSTLIMFAISGVPCAGQVHLGWDAALSNRYVWRGVTRTNEPVLQPDAYLSLQRGDAFITAGAWASIELYRAGEEDLSDTGLDQRGLGEFNYWIEYAAALGALDLRVGWTGYVFDNDSAGGGRTSDFNTSEIYGSVELKLVPLSPKLAVWYDIDNIRGAYIESSASLQVPVLPVASLYLTALAGWSAGQQVSGNEPAERANFADDGLTHIDLSAWASFFVAEQWSVAPALHFQINEDESTRRTTAKPTDADESIKLWLSVALSWTNPLGSGE